MKAIRIFLFSLLLLQARIVAAEQFSYIFIQGDKKTPIYTKVEGVMMPRYGKNYALLAPLAPGPINIEILFQQNEHPPLNFRILVPENGKRAFLLSSKDGKYALYDLEQNFYLQSDNSFEEDHMPAVVTNQTMAVNAAETPKREVPATEKTNVKTPDSEKLYEPEANEGNNQNNTAAVPQPSGKQAPRFIENITFNNEQATGGTIAKATDETGNGATTGGTVTNSDCAGVIGDERFIRLRTDLNLVTNEDQRLGIIQGAIKNNCFSTRQAAELTELLSSDVAKLSALKAFYPKIRDQAEFPSLASLITDEDVKSYFLGFLNK
ncbi:MAG: DUF4476 domain-containing protein [Chitinophagaceae bacterium]